MTDDIPAVPEQPGKTDKPVEKVPGTPEPGKTQEHDQALPDNYKGKTVADIAKMHQELEKKLGEQSSELGTSRKQLEQWKQIGDFIKKNPRLQKAVQEEIERLNGQGGDQPNGGQKSEGSDDTRIATESLVIADFEKRYGLGSLPKDKREKLNEAIGKELADIVDPGGRKTVAEAIRTIPVHRLSTYLEKAYRNVASADREERARSEAFLSAQQNAEAAWGSFPSQQTRGDGVQLSEKQREVARKMGVTEEKYLQQLKTLKKGE